MSFFFDDVLPWLIYLFWWKMCIIGTLSVFTYIIPQFFTFFFAKQNLKQKYDASWALITGGSSGIGLAMAHQLAQQGLNLVIVAIGDKTLENAVDELTETYEDIEVRSVGADLSQPDPQSYLGDIIETTEDIPVQIVFSNAGFIRTGFFDSTPLGLQQALHGCNATASMAISHHFLGRMVREKLRGCIVFTSSPAGFFGSPFSVLYGSTKAYLTELAVSLAPEVRGEGIDVGVVHPSPVASSFYQGATHAIDVLEFFKSTGGSPDVVVDTVLAGVGRRVVMDQGYYSFVARFLVKILDATLFADITAALTPSMPDYIRLRDESRAENKKAIKAPKRSTTPKKKK